MLPLAPTSWRTSSLFCLLALLWKFCLLTIPGLSAWSPPCSLLSPSNLIQAHASKLSACWCLSSEHGFSYSETGILVPQEEAEHSAGRKFIAQEKDGIINLDLIFSSLSSSRANPHPPTLNQLFTSSVNSIAINSAAQAEQLMSPSNPPERREQASLRKVPRD